MKKMTFFLNFISYHIFATYVRGASLGFPAACRLIAVSGARLPSIDGLVVRYVKMHHHVQPAITICLQFISNMFTTDTCIQTQRLLLYFCLQKGFMWTGLTSIQAWKNNYIDYKVWDKLLIHQITYPNSVAMLKFGNGISNFNSYFTGHVITYPCWD